MKIEIFDAQGKLVDTVPANSRRGLSRVEWSMRLKAPRVPPAATAAFEAATGPRVLPGTYTVKMTRGTETYTTPLVVNLDARAKFTVADRKENFDAIMRVYNLLGDMTFDVDRINGVRDELAAACRQASGERSSAQAARIPRRQMRRNAQENRGHHGRRRDHRRRAHPRTHHRTLRRSEQLRRPSRRTISWRALIH